MKSVLPRRNHFVVRQASILRRALKKWPHLCQSNLRHQGDAVEQIRTKGNPHDDREVFCGEQRDMAGAAGVRGR